MRHLAAILSCIVALSLSGCSSTEPLQARGVWVLDNQTNVTVREMNFKRTGTLEWVVGKHLLPLPLEPGMREGVLFADLGGCGVYDVQFVHSMVFPSGEIYVVGAVVSGLDICNEHSRLTLTDKLFQPSA